MATIPTIQLFRNSIIKTGRQAAIDALEAQKASVPDGGLILARYSSDGTENGVKTLLGIVRNSGSANAELTVIDVEGAAENVQTAITSAINKLNKEDTAVVGQYVSSVSEANGIITVTRTPLPSVEKHVMVGEAVTAVTQTNGEIGVEYGSINAYNVSVTDSMGRFDSDNVEGALDELFTFLNSGLGSLGAQIGALSTSSTVTLESVDETEGFLKVYTIKQGDRKVGTINIPKDLVVTSGSVVKGTWNDGTFTEEESGSGTALKLVIANQTNPVYINTLDLVKDHTAGNGIAISDTNEISVKKASDSEPFLTVGADGVKLSGVQNAINTAAASAKTKVEKTDGGSHVTLSHASNTDGSVTYTISESDIASANALTAETTARESADTALSDRLGDGVTSELTATAQFTALNDKIEAETTARTNADNDLLAQLQTLSGTSASLSGDTSVNGAKKYTDAKIEALDLTQVGGADKVITTISQADGKVSASAIDLTASNVKANASSSSAIAVAVDGATVEAQIASLAQSIKSVSTTAAAAHTKVTAKPSGHVTVEVSNDGSHDVVTIAENDIASASDLGTETTARQNQDDKIEAAVGLNEDGTHAPTTGNYTNGATTVVGEIAALDTKLKEVSDTLGTGVSTVATVTAQLQALSGRTGDASGVTSVEGAKAYAKDLVDKLNAEVGSTTGTSKTEAIKIVQDMGKIKSITLGAFDCGTYN